MPQKKKVVNSKVAKKSAPKWYLISSIIISAGSILTNLVYNETTTINPFTITLNVILFAWLVTNIVMLSKFVRGNAGKGAIWLASIYLFDFVFSFAIAFIAGAYAAVNAIPIETVANFLLLRILLNIFPLVTLVLAIVLYSKR